MISIKFLSKVKTSWVTAALLTILCNTVNASSESCVTNKYVFDIGSGGINAIGYEVNDCTKEIKKILSEIYYPLPLQNYISNSKDGRSFSKTHLLKGEKAIFHIKKSLDIDCQKEKCLALATAWARNASNSRKLINIIQNHGIKTSIISQHDEGKVAFHSLVNNLKIDKTKEKETVVFDIGGGSFQLTYKDFNNFIRVYQGPYGMFNFKKLIKDRFDYSQKPSFFAIRKIKKFAFQTIGINISKEKTLLSVLAKNKGVVFGSGAFIGNSLKSQFNFGNKVTLKQIETAINNTIGKNIEEIQNIYPNMPSQYAINSQFSLLIIYAIMKSASIKHIIIPNNLKINEYVALHGLTPFYK